MGFDVAAFSTGLGAVLTAWAFAWVAGLVARMLEGGADD